jgi:hypothetical protein
MSTKLGSLISGIKRAVIEAHRSMWDQHIDELANYFQPARDQPAGTPEQPKFPEGAWEPRCVVMNVQKEVHRNGEVTLEPHPVHVPLITLVPLKSHLIERFELLTTLDLAVAGLTDDDPGDQDDMLADITVNLGSKGPNTAEIKIVIQAADLPPGYARLIGAYEKLLNAQLPT